MSRLSHIFHSSPASDAVIDQSPSAQTQSKPAETGSSLIDDAVKIAVESSESLAADANGFLEKLRPKLKEIVQDVLDEEQRICVEVNKNDPIATLKKLPVIPALASRLPEPVKTRIKDAITTVASKIRKEEPATENSPTGTDSSAPAATSGSAAPSGNTGTAVAASSNADAAAPSAPSWCKPDILSKSTNEGLASKLGAAAASVQQQSANVLSNFSKCAADSKSEESPSQTTAPVVSPASIPRL